MNMLMTVVVALVFCLSTMAQTQDSSSQGSQNNPGTQNQAPQNDQSKASSGQQQMSGNVSKDGKTFQNDSNNQRYKVDNPEALQGQEGQHVAVVIHIDPDTNTIHVIQIAPPQ